MGFARRENPTLREKTMNAWLVVASCGDYYCERDHVLAVALDEHDAEALLIDALAQTSTYIRRDGRVDSYPRWTEVRIDNVETDVLRDEVVSVTDDQRV